MMNCYATKHPKPLTMFVIAETTGERMSGVASMIHPEKFLTSVFDQKVNFDGVTDTLNTWLHSKMPNATALELAN